MLKSEERARDYREKASQAALIARSCDLQRVREKHQLAASMWLGLARFEDQRSAMAHRPANPPVKPGAPSPD